MGPSFSYKWRYGRSRECCCSLPCFFLSFFLCSFLSPEIGWYGPPVFQINHINLQRVAVYSSQYSIVASLFYEVVSWQASHEQRTNSRRLIPTMRRVLHIGLACWGGEAKKKIFRGFFYLLCIAYYIHYLRGSFVGAKNRRRRIFLHFSAYCCAPGAAYLRS